MDSSDKVFLARTALTLFVIGLIAPFIIAIFASEGIAMGFGVVTEVLALILGILSWKHTFGKIATIGVGVLLVVSGIQYIAYMNIRANAETEMEQALKAHKSDAEQVSGGNGGQRR